MTKKANLYIFKEKEKSKNYSTNVEYHRYHAGVLSRDKKHGNPYGYVNPMTCFGTERWGRLEYPKCTGKRQGPSIQLWVNDMLKRPYFSDVNDFVGVFPLELFS